jgi:hypothetical protein
MSSDAIDRLISTLDSAGEEIADLAYLAVRDQIHGSDDAKNREKKLMSARRAVVKAADALRSL